MDSVVRRFASPTSVVRAQGVVVAVLRLPLARRDKTKDAKAHDEHEENTSRRNAWHRDEEQAELGFLDRRRGGSAELDSSTLSRGEDKAE